MQRKAAISFPIALLVSIIAVAIIIGVAVYFLWVTKEKIEVFFPELLESIKNFIRVALGPLGVLIG